MTCGYCRFSNSEDDHRCRRCGRRLMGTATAAPAHLATEHVRIAVKALGANALATARVVEPETQVRPVRTPQPSSQPRVQARLAVRTIDSAVTVDERPAAAKSRPAQPSLFGAELQPKIIPFENINRAPLPVSTGGGAAAAPALAPLPAPASAPKVSASKPASRPAPKRKDAASDQAQASLDFLPPLRNTPRTLKTSAEAVIFCDAAVAAPIHRAIAASLDLSMIMAAYGTALGIFQAIAKPVALDRNALFALGALLVITALFYGLLFAIAGSVTPGMRWTSLRLINFDGFEPDGRSRAVRFAGACISFASGGLGLVWALLDEENLTWHDHISKTFPTLTESESIVHHSKR